MRTTIRIDDELLREAKTAAAASGTTLGEMIEAALRESLRRRNLTRHRKRIVLPTHGGGQFQPGVNIDDSAGLLALMDQEDDPSRR